LLSRAEPWLSRLILIKRVVSFLCSVLDLQSDDAICRLLKERGRLVNKSTITHSYPFCWRSDTPLIYKAVPSWFVNVEDIKARLLVNNEKTYWVPSFVKEKRFHNWLADARDWCVSRNRYWGTPLPIWANEDLSEVCGVCLWCTASFLHLTS
jgi:isoleucyl-tRNA synthetase